MNRSALLGNASAAHAMPTDPRITAAPIPVRREAPLVAILVPSDDDWKADMSMAMAGMCAFTTGNHIAKLFIANQKASMITMARNDLVKQALDVKADYLLFVDSDMVFPNDALGRLMGYDLDIVGATYNKRVPPFETLGRIRPEPGKTVDDLMKGGLHEAEYLPGGFLMVKADVFRKLEWPWFFECFNRMGPGMDAFLGLMRDSFMLAPTTALEQSLRDNAELQKFFAETWPLEPGNRIMSEDYSFMRKARRAGYQVWCDITLTWQMKHIGQQDVTCVPGQGATSATPQPTGARMPLPAGRPPSIVTV